MTMPNLSIKNVSAEVVASLRERASANHRSLQGELLALVSQAAGGEFSTDAAGPSKRARKGHKSIEQIASEHRQHIKRPVSKGQRSTELIRQDRDAR
jgi:plasmid stability protein